MSTEIIQHPVHMLLSYSMVVIPGYLYQDLLSLGDRLGKEVQGKVS